MGLFRVHYCSPMPYLEPDSGVVVGYVESLGLDPDQPDSERRATSWSADAVPSLADDCAGLGYACALWCVVADKDAEGLLNHIIFVRLPDGVECHHQAVSAQKPFWQVGHCQASGVVDPRGKVIM